MADAEPVFVRNPLTGRFGMYAPMAADVPRSQRPLPSVADAVLSSPCTLCKRVDAVAGELVVAQPNDAPLSKGHTLLTWKRHIVSPVQATASEWESLLTQVGNLMGDLDSPVAYGNLGVHSGASQHHLHAHVLEGPDDSEAAQFSSSRCPLCAQECPEVLRVGPWSLNFVPGGRHGEVVAVHDRHANSLDDFPALAELLVFVFAQFDRAGWESSRLFWHQPGHAHIHIQPCITADGALESGGQIAVSRYGYEHLSVALTS